MKTHVVYWLFDGRCTKPALHGYVGVTNEERWHRRLWGHRNEGPLRDRNFQARVLFTGSQADCLKLEKLLRPTPGMGWNQHTGGFKTGGGGRGVPKSPEHREKQRLAALARYAKPGEKERTAEAVKEALKGVDRSGANNAMFGRQMSEETKAKIRAKIAERGGVSGAANPNWRGGR